MPPQKTFQLERSWLIVLEDLGVSAGELLTLAALPLNTFEAGQRLSTAEYFRFWQSLETLAGNEELAINVAKSVVRVGFSPVVLAAACSSDALEAGRRINTYKRLVAPVAFAITESPSAVTFEYTWTDSETAPPATLAAIQLAFFVDLVRHSTRRNIVPLAATLSSEPFDAASLSAFLGVRVVFGERTTLSLSLEDAKRPFLSFAPQLWSVYEPLLKQQLSDLDASVSVEEKVSTSLRSALPSGEFSRTAIARRLAMSERSLSRALRSEGTSFAAILADTRKTMAIHYLRDTEMTPAEIAFLLSYQDSNSFFRAFKSWTGRTPLQFRQHH